MYSIHLVWEGMRGARDGVRLLPEPSSGNRSKLNKNLCRRSQRASCPDAIYFATHDHVGYTWMCCKTLYLHNNVTSHFQLLEYWAMRGCVGLFRIRWRVCAFLSVSRLSSLCKFASRILACCRLFCKHAHAQNTYFEAHLHVSIPHCPAAVFLVIVTSSARVGCFCVSVSFESERP